MALQTALSSSHSISTTKPHQVHNRDPRGLYGALLPALVPPSFAFPNKMSGTTVYDSLYNVVGFRLLYEWYGGLLYPMSYAGQAYAGLYEVIASDSYQAGKSAPDPATWVPILFDGPNLPNVASVLDAWINVYGDLPPEGSIKFQMFPVDPVTGASGPPLSATVGWKSGTLHGANRATLTGPFFAFSTDPANIAITVPGSGTATFALSGVNGYGGTISYAAQKLHNRSQRVQPEKEAIAGGSHRHVRAPHDHHPARLNHARLLHHDGRSRVRRTEL